MYVQFWNLPKNVFNDLYERRRYSLILQSLNCPSWQHPKNFRREQFYGTNTRNHLVGPWEVGFSSAQARGKSKLYEISTCTFTISLEKHTAHRSDTNTNTWTFVVMCVSECVTVWFHSQPKSLSWWRFPSRRNPTKKLFSIYSISSSTVSQIEIAFHFRYPHETHKPCTAHVYYCVKLFCFFSITVTYKSTHSSILLLLPQNPVHSTKFLLVWGFPACVCRLSVSTH